MKKIKLFVLLAVVALGMTAISTGATQQGGSCDPECCSHCCPPNC